MKITVDIDCTPAEMRAFFGLPDVEPMQQAIMDQMQERLLASVDQFSPRRCSRTGSGRCPPSSRPSSGPSGRPARRVARTPTAARQVPAARSGLRRPHRVPGRRNPRRPKGRTTPPAPTPRPPNAVTRPPTVPGSRAAFPRPSPDQSQTTLCPSRPVPARPGPDQVPTKSPPLGRELTSPPVAPAAIAMPLPSRC